MMARMQVVAESDRQDIFLCRIFEARRELVFEAYTDPKAIPTWWGPKGHTTTVDQMELKKGGIWRYIHRDSDANEYVHTGVYHEVTSPERLVTTYELEGMPGVGLVIVTFAEQPDGATKLTEQSIFPSIETRNAVLQSGMTDGASQTFDRLEELLAQRRP